MTTISLNVTITIDHIGPPPPQPVINISPVAVPHVSDNTVLGAIVATATVTMDSGAAPFTGTLTMTDPDNVFALVSLGGTPPVWNIIVDPSGPGLGNIVPTGDLSIVDRVSLTATE